MITPEGDYLSNLQAPDLRPYFKHLHWRQMGHSMGHLVASDWADKADDDPVFGLYKKCGLWTRDEAAILYNVARLVQPGRCIDIGCNVGWTTRHIREAHTIPNGKHVGLRCSVGEFGCSALTRELEHNYIDFVDPICRLEEFRNRFVENCGWPGQPAFMTSMEWFSFLDSLPQLGGDREYQKAPYPNYVLACIDGDHEPGAPLQDAQNAYKHLADTGVIIFHDFIGGPVREAVTWLMDQGFKARVYFTPHLVACCWRGDFAPPVHEPDPRIDWRAHLTEMSRDFDFGRLS